MSPEGCNLQGSSNKAMELAMSRQDNITQEYLKSILDYNPDTGIFTWKVRKSTRIKIGDVAGYREKYKNTYYIYIGIDGILYAAHRLAYLYVYGWLPEEVDHIDNDGPKDDNRICNLRDSSHGQNQYNTGLRSDNTSGCKGVTFYKKSGKWHARIWVNKIKHHLGYYSTKEEAAAAYAEASEKYHGKYGRLA